MRVVLLYDASALEGRPDEQDAWVQVEVLEKALRARGHETLNLGFGLDLAKVGRELVDARADVVVNLVESVGGEGRLVHFAPAFLDTLRLPYTGASAEATFLTSHKVLSKQRLLACGLATPPWMDSNGAAGGPVVFPGRFLVKSVWEEASLGLEDDAVVDAEDEASLLEAIESRRHRMGGEAFAEAWVEGREFNVALLEVDGEMHVLPVAEIHFVDYPEGKPHLVGYRAKWADDSFEYHHTPRSFDFGDRDHELVSDLSELARRACAEFGVGGYARVDFRVDENGHPWILELNTNPCLSPDAGFMAAAARAGYDLESVADALLCAARGAGSEKVSVS